MKLKLHNQCLFIFLFFFIFSNFTANSSNINELHSKENISSYFSGLLSSKNNNTSESLEFFSNVKGLSEIHFPFVEEFTTLLIRERKIKGAKRPIIVSQFQCFLRSAFFENAVFT